jgi:hypothetical protein
VSKSADLDPKTNLTTNTETTAVATVERLRVFGSPQLLQGEDEAACHDFLGRVYAAVKPVGILDEMHINDLAYLQWEVLRWRRLKSSLMQMRGLKTLEKFLRKHLDFYHYRQYFERDLSNILQQDLACQALDDARRLAHRCTHNNDPNADGKVNQILRHTNLTRNDIDDRARARKADRLAQGYLRRKPGAIRLVDKLLARAGLSIDTIMAEALADELDNIERIDRLTAIAETRRNAALREIDRRRAALGERLRRHVQEVEAEVIDAGEVIKKRPTEAKSAA